MLLQALQKIAEPVVITPADSGATAEHPLVIAASGDERPVLSMTGQSSVSEGSPATFTLTLNRPSEQPTDVELMLTNIGTEPGDVSGFVVFTNPADPVGSALVVTNGRRAMPAGPTWTPPTVTTASSP